MSESHALPDNWMQQDQEQISEACAEFTMAARLLIILILHQMLLILQQMCE